MKSKGIKKLISAALSASLVLGTFGGGLVASAAPAPTTANYGQFQVKLTADPVTDEWPDDDSVDPDVPDGFGYADSAGRIWTDKSVTAQSDGTFGVKLSALAQEYMTATTTGTSVGSSGGNPNAPAADVTFILDMSTSMGNGSTKGSGGYDILQSNGTDYYYRIQAMSYAADNAIKTIMDANPNNRVAVYSFGGAATADHLATIMDLGHYEAGTVSTQSPGGYLTYVNSTTIKHTANLKKGSTTYSGEFKTGGGTPTQDGIMYGISSTIDKLASLKTTDTAPKRQPYVFILSDGAAIHAKTSWYTSPSGYSFEDNYPAALPDALDITKYKQPSGEDKTGKYIPATASTSLASTGSADIAALTVLTAAYMKDLLGDKYTAYNNGETTTAKVYTVGLGSNAAINGPSGTSSVFAWAGLDPANVYANRTDNTYFKGSADTTGPAVATYNKVQTYAASGPSVNYKNAFVYSDAYTHALTFDVAKGAFDGMASDVEASTTILPLLNIPESTGLGDSESADMDSAIAIVDEIGEGFEVNMSTLKIGDSVAAVDTTTTASLDDGTAYQFAGYGSKVVIKTTDDDVTTLTWYIDSDDMQPHIYRFTNRTSPVTGQYTAPTNGAFTLNYKVKPELLSPNQVVETTYYLNSGNTDGARTAAYFKPPTDSPYYLNFTDTQTLPKTDGITGTATYVSEESLAGDRVTMMLGNNGRLDLEMGIVKTGPATVKTGGNIEYKVTIYNYTNTDKTGLTVNSDGDTPKTGVVVLAGDSTELTFNKTAPSTLPTPPTITSDQAEISGIGLKSNTVETEVTDVITHRVTTHVIGDVGGSASGGGDHIIDKDSVTLTATPDDGYVFVGWYSTNAGTGTPVSEDTTYTITSVEVDGDFYAKFNAVPVAVNDNYLVMKGETLSVPAPGILSNDTDADSVDTLTAVDVSPISDSTKGTLNVNTADGSFTFEALTPGYATFTYKADDGISQSNTATVTITITTPSVVGSVYDRDNNVPVFGATVVLSDSGGDEIATTTTDEDGNYVFADVPAGNYKLKVTGHGFSPAHRDIVVSTATGDENGVVTENFKLVGFEVTLTAVPSIILGNGTDASDFTAVVIDKDGNKQVGVEVVFEVPNIDYGHFANGTNTITAVTDADGSATVTFTSEAFGGATQTVPLTATVNDSARDLYAEDTIHITFNPGAIVGIVTDQEGNPVNGAKVEVSKVFGGGGTFNASIITGSDGRYTIGIPKGDESYDVLITKPVKIGGVDTLITFTQIVTVSGSIGSKTFEANKTASGIVLIGKPSGSSALDGTTGGGYAIELTDSTGNHTYTGSIDVNGVFNIDDVPSGNYTADIIYNISLPGGGTAPVVIGHADITINSSGQISISEVLIDPYGTITDSVTGNPISGVTVVLHYSDGTKVILPPVLGFPPADNDNPQTSDTTGQYAFMVFPHTDYYITATKRGYYEDFDSRTVDVLNPLIHVGTDIVRYDFSMKPLSDDGDGGSSTTTVPTKPVTEPTKPAQSVDLATAILVDKMKAEEGDTVTFTVIYANKTASDADGVYVKVNIPPGMSVVDANGGVVTGNEIKWSLGKLAGDTRGKLTYKLKVNDMSKGEDFAVVTAEVGSDNKLTLINPQDDSSLIKVLGYSNRYEHKHERYIIGYPDGTVKPENSITRAEVAAIFARTLKLQGEVRHVKMFSDVDTGYWGAEYIETVAARGIFKGYADNTFGPDKPITRAELAAAIARYLGVAQEMQSKDILRISPLTDISGNWAEQSLDELYRFGIVSGYGDGSFHPNNTITRAEAFKMINGMLYRGPLNGAEPSYPDNLIDRWSFGQVEEATRSHISKFNADGSETMIEFIPEPLW